MAGNQDYAEFFSDQHHTALGRPAQLSQQFRMTGIVIAGVLENALADRSGGHGIGDTGEGKLRRYDDVAVGRMTPGLGRTARP